METEAYVQWRRRGECRLVRHTFIPASHLTVWTRRVKGDVDDWESSYCQRRTTGTEPVTVWVLDKAWKDSVTASFTCRELSLVTESQDIKFQFHLLLLIHILHYCYFVCLCCYEAQVLRHGLTAGGTVCIYCTSTVHLLYIQLLSVQITVHTHSVSLTWVFHVKSISSDFWVHWTKIYKVEAICSISTDTVKKYHSHASYFSIKSEMCKNIKHILRLSSLN